jgi:hypothetical protein
VGDFDDVLAMEPGDEWDDYDPATHSGPATDRLPAVAELHAPAVSMVLRGEVPDELVAALAPLGTRPEVVAAPQVCIDVEVAPVEGSTAGGGSDRWGLVDRDLGELGVTGTVSELAVELVQRLVDLTRRAEVRQLLLPAAGVRLADGRGVLVVEPDPALRHRLVGALLGEGGGYLGADHVVAVPGSRTVLPLPTPLHHDDSRPVGQVAPMAVIDLVVVPDAATPADAAPEPLGRAHGCARLLAAVAPGPDDASDALGVVATLCAGADVWSVPCQDPDGFASAVAGLPGTSPRELVTWRRPVPDDEGLVVVRFARGGVVADLGRGAVLEVAESELGAIDTLGWATGATHSGAADALLGQLAAAGVDLRPALAVRHPRPLGPESYGLPGSPTGAASASMWTAGSLDRSRVEPGPLAALMVAAAQRGDVQLDDATLEKLRIGAAELDERRQVALDLLEELLGAFEERGIEPLVVGPAVLVHDGPVPCGLVELDSVELLVAGGDLPEAEGALAALHGASLESAGHEVAAAAEPTGDDEALSEHRPAAVRSSVVAVVERSGVVSRAVVRDRLAAGPFGELVDHDELLDRAVPIRVGSRWVRALHPDDRFVHACAEVAGADRAPVGSLRRVVLSAPASRSGMAAVLEASARWGATRQVLDAIRVVDAALPGLSHWLVERATRPAPAPDRRRRRGLRRR